MLNHTLKGQRISGMHSLQSDNTQWSLTIMVDKFFCLHKHHFQYILETFQLATYFFVFAAR